MAYIWIGVVVAVALAVALAFQAPGNAVSDFLATNKNEAGVQQTASGLQYKVLTAGAGAAPTESDVALVMYRGTLTNGDAFDQSERPTPFPLGEKAVVPGFEEAMKLIPKGGKYRVWIKPTLAYGAEDKKDAAGKVVIPANSVLVFDIEMIDFLSKAAIQQMQQEQQLRQLQQGGGAGLPPGAGPPPEGPPTGQ